MALNLSWIIIPCELLLDMIKIVLLNSSSPTCTCLNSPGVCPIYKGATTVVLVAFIHSSVSTYLRCRDILPGLVLYSSDGLPTFWLEGIR